MKFSASTDLISNFAKFLRRANTGWSHTHVATERSFHCRCLHSNLNRNTRCLTKHSTNHFAFMYFFATHLFRFYDRNVVCVCAPYIHFLFPPIRPPVLLASLLFQFGVFTFGFPVWRPVPAVAASSNAYLYATNIGERDTVPNRT